jgi:hypothetical protein
MCCHWLNGIKFCVYCVRDQVLSRTALSCTVTVSIRIQKKCWTWKAAHIYVVVIGIPVVFLWINGFLLHLQHCTVNYILLWKSLLFNRTVLLQHTWSSSSHHYTVLFNCQELHNYLNTDIATYMGVHFIMSLLVSFHWGGGLSHRKPASFDNLEFVF